MNDPTSENRKGAGTIAWQSPEILEGGSRTFEGDIYAFGMTIYEVNAPIPGWGVLLIAFPRSSAASDHFLSTNKHTMYMRLCFIVMRDRQFSQQTTNHWCGYAYWPRNVGPLSRLIDRRRLKGSSPSPITSRYVKLCIVTRRSPQPMDLRSISQPILARKRNLRFAWMKSSSKTPTSLSTPLDVSAKYMLGITTP